jgi:hypothetical protein
MRLEERIETGGRGGRVKCRDGFSMSVIAGPRLWCHPRPGDMYGPPEDFPGPYNQVEVGYPTEKPEPWEQWEPYQMVGETPEDGVYGYVPVNLVRELVELHGGEVE